MSCCGETRKEFRQISQAQTENGPTKGLSSQPRPEDASPAYFQYFGKLGLTVIGPRTGKRYRFDNPGAVVAVDPRDRRALRAVPTLREVEKLTDIVKEV
jgi:hypothetical protein